MPCRDRADAVQPLASTTRGGVEFGEARFQASAGRADHQQRFPDVSVDLPLSDAHVDLVGERFDLAIRVGRVVQSSLVVVVWGCRAWSSVRLPII